MYRWRECTASSWAPHKHLEGGHPHEQQAAGLHHPGQLAAWPRGRRPPRRGRGRRRRRGRRSCARRRAGRARCPAPRRRRARDRSARLPADRSTPTARPRAARCSRFRPVPQPASRKRRGVPSAALPGREGAVEQAEADRAHARVPPLPVFGGVHALVFGGVQETRPPVDVSPVRAKTRRSTKAEPPVTHRQGHVVQVRSPVPSRHAHPEASRRGVQREGSDLEAVDGHRQGAPTEGLHLQVEVFRLVERRHHPRPTPHLAAAGLPARRRGRPLPGEERGIGAAVADLHHAAEVVLPVEQALADHEVVAGGGQVVGTREDPVGRPGEGRAQVRPKILALVSATAANDTVSSAGIFFSRYCTTRSWFQSTKAKPAAQATRSGRRCTAALTHGEGRPEAESQEGQHRIEPSVREIVPAARAGAQVAHEQEGRGQGQAREAVAADQDDEPQESAPEHRRPEEKAVARREEGQEQMGAQEVKKGLAFPGAGESECGPSTTRTASSARRERSEHQKARARSPRRLAPSVR